MGWFKDMWFRLTTIVGRNRFESVMDDEMEFHLEMAVQEKVDRGMDPVAAKKQALKEFGSPESFKEDCRDSWGARVVMDLIRDLKFAIRKLKKSPGFAAVAIVSLGIAIGANTAIFSLLNTILFKPLPVPNPADLREITFVSPVLSNSQIRGASTTLPDGRREINALNYSVFLQLQENAESYADVVGFSEVPGIQTRLRGDLFTTSGMLVSGNFCEGLRVGAILGRTIQPEDDQAGVEPVVMVSYDYWVRRFNGDADALGELITLNNVGFRLIGVLPRDFKGPQHGEEQQFYIPLSTQPIVQPELELTNDNHWWIWVMARLKPGSSDEQLKASLDLALERAIGSDRFATGSSSRNGVSVTSGRQGNPREGRVILKDETDRYNDYMRSILLDGRAGSRNQGGRMATPFYFMLGAAGIVFLAACANLAGLLVARSISQQHETATRKALGAGSLRLVRQGLTESLLLAVLGAVFGWFVSIGAKAGIIQSLSSVAIGEGIDGGNDHRVFLFVTSITFVAAILFGLLPSLRSMKINLMDALRDRSDSRGGWLTGRVFVALQVGLALLLIVGAGLMIRSFSNLQKIDPGFNMEKLLVFQLNAQNGGYEGPQKLELYQKSMDVIRTIPGVQSVACSEVLFLANSARRVGVITAPDNPDFEGENVMAMTVSEDFFHTLEIPLLSGRVFEATDAREAERVVIVNEQFSRRFFGERNPVGKLVKQGNDNLYRVVGVCADTKYNRIKADVQPMLFFPIKQSSTGRFGLRRAWIQVKTEMDPLALVPTVRKAMAEVDPNLPLNSVKTQAIQMSDSIFREKLQASLLMIFAVLGVFLSCIGTYGLMAYTVSRRTSEIGIRKALGARSDEAIRPILKSSLVVAGVGLVLGAVFVLPLGNLIRGQLYRVDPLDPMVLSLGVLLLFAASVAAAWFPARKAAKVSPMEALRVE